MTKKVKDTKAMKLTPKIMEELGFYLEKEKYVSPVYISTIEALRVKKEYSLNDIKDETLGEFVEKIVTRACKEVEWETKKKMREALGLNF
jgi:methyltransferase-like protein